MLEACLLCPGRLQVLISILWQGVRRQVITELLSLFQLVNTVPVRLIEQFLLQFLREYVLELVCNLRANFEVIFSLVGLVGENARW